MNLTSDSRISAFYTTSRWDCKCRTFKSFEISGCNDIQVAEMWRDMRANNIPVCCLVPFFSIIYSYVDSLKEASYLKQTSDDIWCLQSALPEYACNLVGEPIPDQRCSPEVRWFILISLKLIDLTQDEKSENLQRIFNFVNTIMSERKTATNECNTPKMTMKMFEEEDGKLIAATSYMARIFSDMKDEAKVHILMQEFMSIIGFDHNVLLDWLTSDEETSTELLRLLIFYLKLDSSQIHDPVKRVFAELQHRIYRLTEKKLFPFDADPLMKLLRRVT